MYRVELIAKQSVMNDIRQSWVNSGREDNADHGVFVFEDADTAFIISPGVLEITRIDNRRYLYNIADFYRVKIQFIGDE